ncbi:MAG TPA: phage tail protein [Syntrophorhabdales bacterium]|nr:phage tail protein [Syntrophorhabdales bacterium]
MKLSRIAPRSMLIFAATGCLFFMAGQMPAVSSQVFAELKLGGKRTPPPPPPPEICYDLNHISVEIDGVKVTKLHSVEGVDMCVQPEAEANAKLARIQKPGTIAIARDWSNTLEWHDWRKKITDGKMDKRTVSIIYHNAAGAEDGRANFVECFPTAHVLPIFNAKNSGHATETIVLAYPRKEFIKH